MFKYIYAFFIYLIPFSLVVGSAVIDINLSLIALITISYIVVKNKEFIKISKKFWFLYLSYFLFYFLINVSSFVSSNYLLSYEYSIFYLRFFLFALGIYIALINNYIKIRVLIYCFAIIYLFIFFDGFYQFFTGYDIFGYKWDGDRLSAFFGEEKILGSFISRTYPFFFGLASYYYKDKFIITSAFIGFIFADILVIISGDRTAAFYLIISSIIIVCLTRRFQLIRLLTLVVSSILVIIILTTTPVITERIYYKTINDITKKNESLKFSDKFYFFTPIHHGYLLTSFKMLKENPLFGVGPKIYREQCDNIIYKVDDNIYCSSHPHNTYLQLLAETGLLTTLMIFFLFLFLIYLFSAQLYSRIFNAKFILSDTNICFLTCLFISLFPFIPTGNFFGSWMNAIYYLPLGFIMYEIINQSKNENTISNK